MNKYLESAVERWVKQNKKKEFLISPISHNDANIIHELIQAVGKLNGERSEDLKSILKEWKYLKDESIYDLLLQFNIDNVKQPEEDESEEEIKSKRRFIEFENQIIEARLILTIGIEEGYNFKSKEMDYRIVINKDLEEKYQLTNGYFNYNQKSIRDKKLKELQNKMSKFITIIGKQ